MKEANIFEAWAENLLEGTWATPNTPEQQQELIALLSQELPVGADATNATTELYSLVGDDRLFDQLQDLAEQDPDADCRNLVIARIKDMSDNGFDDFDTVLDALKSTQLAPPTVAPAAPAAPVAEQDDEEYSVDGGMNNELLQDGMLGSIVGGIGGAALTKSPGGAMAGAKLGSAAQDAFGEESVTPDPKYAHEPPAQESDPSKYAHEPPPQESDPIPDDQDMDPIPDDQGDDQDIIARLQQLAGMGESLKEELQADDGEYYESADDFFGQFEAESFDNEETSPDGMEVRGYIDGVNVMVWRYDDESMTGGYGYYDDSAMAEEVAVTTGNPPLEETTALQGQYGHSGKLQKFDDVEEDVLHRLRQLSGMIRS